MKIDTSHSWAYFLQLHQPDLWYFNSWRWKSSLQVPEASIQCFKTQKSCRFMHVFFWLFSNPKGIKTSSHKSQVKPGNKEQADNLLLLPTTKAHLMSPVWVFLQLFKTCNLISTFLTLAIIVEIWWSFYTCLFRFWRLARHFHKSHTDSRYFT